MPKGKGQRKGGGSDDDDSDEERPEVIEVPPPSNDCITPVQLCFVFSTTLSCAVSFRDSPFLLIS